MRTAMTIASVVLLVACGGKQSPTPPPPQEQAFADPDPGSDTDPGSEPDPRSAAPDPDPGAPGEPRPPTVDDRVAPPSGGGSVADEWVAAHNAYRKQHCAPPLTWSPELANAAQAWADHLRKADCAFEHSRTRYGENLAGGTSGALGPASSVDMWYREVDKYNFKRGGFSMDTGHFTQLVWADTKHVGCGMTTCKGLDIIVCNYDPPGNVEGAYRTNVKPKGCK